MHTCPVWNPKHSLVYYIAMQTECGASAATRKYTYVPTIVSSSIIKRIVTSDLCSF